MTITSAIEQEFQTLSHVMSHHPHLPVMKKIGIRHSSFLIQGNLLSDLYQ